MSGRIGPLQLEPVLQDGLVVYLNAASFDSYPKTGHDWYDLSGYGNNATLGRDYPDSYPTYYNGPARIRMSEQGAFPGGATILPGNSYTYPTNFTWQIWHYYNSAYDLEGLFWSEQFNKNFLTLYRNVDGNIYGPYPFARIDTGNSVYWSLYSGTIFNGGFNSILTGRWELTTIIKNGTTFSWYWADVLKWQVVIPDWIIYNSAQQIFIGNINGFNFPSNVDIGQVMMYNRVLTDTEIAYNYNSTKPRFGL